MMCTSNRVHYGPIRLLAHYTTSLSSFCRRIRKYWTSKMIVRYILSSVCLRLSQFSQLSFMQYMGLFVFNLPIYRMMIVRVCVLNIIIIIKVETWTIWHCLGFGHETMVCAVCLSMVLPDIAYLKRKIKMMLIVVPARNTISICWSNTRLLAWPTPIEIYTPWHEDPRTVPNWRCDWANHVLCADLIGTSACLHVVAVVYLKQDRAPFFFY